MALIDQIKAYQSQYKAPTPVAPTTHTVAPAITYTPDGQARAPGYYVPSNPYDTGYAGNRNYEKVGFGKNTDPNWDYENGRPIGNFALGANGLYNFSNSGDLLGGAGGGGGGGYSGGGSFNPNMGTYGADVAQAKLAYDRAVANKDKGIQQLNRATGFMRVGDKTQIDPNNPYGALQLMLGNHGQQLDDAWAAAQDRGVGHMGLGAQQESKLRFTQGGEVAGLGNQYSDAYSGFLQQVSDAQAAYEAAQQYAAWLAAQQASYDWGGGGGGEDYTDYGSDPLDYNGGSQDWFAPLANADPAKLAAAIQAANKPKAAPKPVSKPKISARKVVSRG